MTGFVLQYVYLKLLLREVLFLQIGYYEFHSYWTPEGALALKIHKCVTEVIELM